MFVALLDTSVLWPSLQRDFLLSLHIQGAYRAVWSDAILGELHFAEVAKLVRRGVRESEAVDRADRLIGEMRTHFADSLVSEWEPHEGTFGLPDENDEHVLAAALVGGAEVIVTHNLKDFPADLLPSSIEALSPAEFVRNTVDLSPRVAIAAVDDIVGRSGRTGPALTREVLLSTLHERYGMAEAVASMRSFVSAGSTG